MERSVPHEKNRKIDRPRLRQLRCQKMTIEAPEGRMDAILQEAKKLIHKLEPDVTVQL